MPYLIRIGQKYVGLNKRLKTELQPFYGKISDERLSNEIADFLEREHLDRLMLNRAKKRRGGGLF